jgi:hypothetical protein
METAEFEPGDRVECRGSVGRLVTTVVDKWAVAFDDGSMRLVSPIALAFMPTELEVRQRAEMVQQRWSEVERQRRIVGPKFGWSIPTVDGCDFDDGDLHGLQIEVAASDDTPVR